MGMTSSAASAPALLCVANVMSDTTTDRAKSGAFSRMSAPRDICNWGNRPSIRSETACCLSLALRAWSFRPPTCGGITGTRSSGHTSSSNKTSGSVTIIGFAIRPQPNDAITNTYRVHTGRST